jgi:small acid-soluble spore protein H (minor)
MDVNRAKEIVESTDKIEVTLNGKNVWIDHVDESSQTATVHPEAGSLDLMKVEVEKLQEVK